MKKFFFLALVFAATFFLIGEDSASAQTAADEFDACEKAPAMPPYPGNMRPGPPQSPDRNHYCNMRERDVSNPPVYGPYGRSYGYGAGAYPYYGYGVGQYGFINPLEPCRDFYDGRQYDSRFCQMGGIKFDSKQAFGFIRAFLSKVTGLNINQTNAYLTPVDEKTGEAQGVVRYGGPITAHDNIFNSNLDRRAGIWRLDVVNGDRVFFSQFIEVYPYYLTGGKPTKVLVTAHRFENDPDVGKIEQRDRSLSYEEWALGRPKPPGRHEE